MSSHATPPTRHSFAHLFLALLATAGCQTAVDGAGPLPAPLYLIDAEGKQILRLETNGQTVTPITSEANPILDFDVSPVDGALAYVTDNDLVLTDALGKRRQVLVDGEPLPEETSGTFGWTQLVNAPRWSPDGKQIAFSMGGIYLITPDGGEPQLIQPNDPVDFTGDIAQYVGARRFNPVAWSPDGERLLLEFAWIPEAGGHAVKTIRDGRLVELKSSTGIYLRPAWSNDGTQIYRADMPSSLGGCSPYDGLYIAQADTGEIDAAITGRTSGTACVEAFVISPYQAGDGRLYFFMAAGNPEALSRGGDASVSIAYDMYRANPDTGRRSILRGNLYNVADALWARDASGAVVAGDQLLWVTPDDREPITLPVKGRALHWGLDQLYNASQR